MKQVVFEKGKSYSYLSKKYDLFSSLVKTYKGTCDIEKCCIDFKVHQLDTGESAQPCIWHFDSYFKPKNYHIYLCGDAIAPTMFVLDKNVNSELIFPQLEPTEQYLLKHPHFKIKHLEVHKKLKTKVIDYESWYSYGHDDLHRATLSQTKGERVLIRLQE